MKAKFFYLKFFLNHLIFLHITKNLEKRSILKRLKKISFTDTFLCTNSKLG